MLCVLYCQSRIVSSKYYTNFSSLVYGPVTVNDLYYVVIGMYGKYKVIDGKAYNENYPTGRLLNSVFDEAK